ncbi:hypothetical protein [Vampirovibrio sp.]|uniref:hypothetical protein n=1 Tax=Vampirovibrio sp. TaxID=2717857 RepID=UPI0035942F93
MEIDLQTARPAQPLLRKKPAVTSVKPPTVRFSGYKYDENKNPSLFLPGFKNAKKVTAEILPSPESGLSAGTKVEMTSQDGYWTLNGNSKLKPGAAYRFHAQNAQGQAMAVPLDFLETVAVKNEQSGAMETFNRIALHDENTPQKSSVFADIYADSILTPAQIQTLDEQERQRLNWGKDQKPIPARLPVLPMRNHFNKFNQITLNPETFEKKGLLPDQAETHGYEEGLNQLVPKLRERGVSAILFKPFMGGDNLSSHRYWTTDPYVLNDTFRNKAAFRNSLDLMLKNGMKVFADGAFVNQGLNGVQVMSNLRNTTDSPYWGNWFKFGDHQPGLKQKLPGLAQQPYKFGVLPTKTVNGYSEIDYAAFAIRLLNNPVDEASYNPKKPTFIELYDPRLEKQDGTPIPLSLNPADHQATAEALKSSNNSVQRYKFPVDPETVRKKMIAPNTGPDPKAKFLDWTNFSLTVPSADDSSKKWDGQIDVALMNTQSEEVVDYLKGAVNYWSRMVMNHYTHTVAQEMQKAKQQLVIKNGKDNVTEADILKAVTQTREATTRILPPETHAVDHINAETAKEFAMASADYEPNQTGGAFAKALLQNVPLNTLQLPVLFKANLNQPTFLTSLALRTGKLQNFLEDRFLDLIDIPYVGKPFELLSNLAFSPRLEKAMGRKMQQVFDELSQQGSAANKLKHANIQSIVADQLGEKFYISLLTGKTLKEAEQLVQNPERLEAAFYESLPPSLSQASPQDAARRLPALLRKRLRELNHAGPNHTPSLQVQVREEVENIVKDLDPQLVNLAAKVIQRREFGLNWRIDAAKDVADMDKVKNTPNDEKARQEFKKQIQYLNQFWGQKLGGAMRAVFPKASVIAELTDFGTLARDGATGTLGETQKKSLFDNNTFTSAPNMEHTYSPLLQLVNYAQRPDEFGASVMTAGKFMKEHLQKMTQAVPLFSQRNFQNLTASPDYTTTTHALMVNPELFNQDRNKQMGLMEFFEQGVHELQNMACFANQRNELKAKLGITTDAELKAWFDDFKQWIHRSSNANIDGDIARKNPEWPPEIYNADNKAALWDEKTKPEKHYLRGPVPHDFKRQFADQVLGLWTDRLDPENGVSTNHRSRLKTVAQKSPTLSSPDANLRQTGIDVLKEQLKRRMSESGEVKAMRAVINNAVVELAKTNHTAQNPQALKTLWDALDKAIKRWGTHFGYQPLDTALNHVFEQFEQANNELNENGLNRDEIEAFKLGIYNTAIKPVLHKQERIFAIQNALPGNPSVYLHDLLGQGGSELTNNIYAQNRGIMRVDKLQEENSDFSRYLERVGTIFKSRNNLEVLNDGIVLPVETDDAHGILPIVRDNGSDQAIVLIDTGKQNVKNGGVIKPLDTDMKSSQYSKVEGQWMDENRTMGMPLTLNSEHLVPETTYIDQESGETFKINQAHQLVKVESDGREIQDFAIRANRILLRKNPAPTAER